MMKADYRIIRFYADGRKNRIMRKGLTQDQAIKHCNREDTSSKTHPNKKNGCSCEWFDGFSNRC